jgi:hypothetical protein
MPAGILLQSEVFIALIKSDEDDALNVATCDFFSSDANEFVPALSTVAYGLTKSAILAASLPAYQQRELETRLRAHRRELDDASHLYVFDIECADEFAIVRQTCRDEGLQLTAELQFEYSIALAKNLAILAPVAAKKKYIGYPSLKIEYL